MKNNQLTFMLVGVFFLSTLATVGLLYKYNSAVSFNQKTVTPNVQVMGKIQQIMQGLIGESLEYSKTHPAINGLLQNVGLMAPPAAVPAPAPAKPVKK